MNTVRCECCAMSHYIHGFIPLKTFFIDKRSQQFNGCKSWLGIVYMYHMMLRKLVPVFVQFFEIYHNVFNSSSTEKVFLFDSIFNHLISAISVAKDFCYLICFLPILYSSIIVTLVEMNNVELTKRFGTPKSDCVRVVCIVTWHSYVIGHSYYLPICNPFLCNTLTYNFTAKRNSVTNIISRYFPRVSFTQPIVRDIYLQSISIKFLNKRPKLVSYSVANSTDVVCGQSFHHTHT
jgi:hypothetical protein